MTQLEAKLADALKTGHIWLNGEMEFTINKGPRIAFNEAYKIACECGYSVEWLYGHSAIKIAGGYMAGYYTLDWFAPDTDTLVKLEYWTSEVAYDMTPVQVPA